jgi:hypothetical protein
MFLKARLKHHPWSRMVLLKDGIECGKALVRSGVDEHPNLRPHHHCLARRSYLIHGGSFRIKTASDHKMMIFYHVDLYPCHSPSSAISKHLPPDISMHSMAGQCVGVLPSS